jgi:hypothetical protein
MGLLGVDGPVGRLLSGYTDVLAHMYREQGPYMTDPTRKR